MAGTQTMLSSDLNSIPATRYQWVTDSKGLAILAIIIYHAFIIAGAQSYPRGDIGVDVFVFLSGFGLALNQREESLASFYLRRLLSIGPRYWICLVFFSGLYSILGIGSTTGVQFLTQAAFGNLFVNTIAGAWWFLTLIVVLYLLYGILRPIIRNGDVGMLMAVGFALLLIFICVLGFVAGSTNGIPSNLYGMYGYVGYRLIDFFFGIAFAIIVRRRAVYRAGSLACAALLGLGWFYWCTSVDAWLLIYPAGGLALLAVFASLSMAVRLSRLRPMIHVLSYFGVYSYELYLIHHPVMQSLNMFFWHRIGVPSPMRGQITLGMVVAFCLTLVAAWALGYTQNIWWLGRVPSLGKSDPPANRPARGDR